MKFTKPMTALAVIFAANGANAQSFNDQIIGNLTDLGYTRIEIDTGITQTKVEAIRGTQKLEVVYDRATGSILKEEREAVEASDDTAPGIEIDQEDEDFLKIAGAVFDNDDDDDDDDEDEADNAWEASEEEGEEEEE